MFWFEWYGLTDQTTFTYVLLCLKEQRIYTDIEDISIYINCILCIILLTDAPGAGYQRYIYNYKDALMFSIIPGSTKCHSAFYFI